MSIFLPNIKSRRGLVPLETKSLTGFTLVEIMIVVAIIALLAAIAIPNFVKSRWDARCTACASNMRVIDAAIQQYLLMKGLPESGYVDVTLDVLKEAEYLHEAPKCPAGKKEYTSITNETGIKCPNDGNSDYHGWYKNGIYHPPGEPEE